MRALDSISKDQLKKSGYSSFKLPGSTTEPVIRAILAGSTPPSPRTQSNWSSSTFRQVQFKTERHCKSWSVLAKSPVPPLSEYALACTLSPKKP